MRLTVPVDLTSFNVKVADAFGRDMFVMEFRIAQQAMMKLTAAQGNVILTSFVVKRADAFLCHTNVMEIETVHQVSMN